MIDNRIQLNNMAEEFNIKEGIAKSLKTALQSDSFISAVFSMLMGEKVPRKKSNTGLSRRHRKIHLTRLFQSIASINMVLAKTQS